MTEKEPSRRKGFAITLGLILLLLLALEAGFRAVEGRVSGNLAHLREIPQIVANLGGRDSVDGELGVIVMGNSLINNGVDAHLFQRVLADRIGRRVDVAKLTPDASYSWDWWCIGRTLGERASQGGADALVIGFAWGLITDYRRPTAERLGAYFCDWDALPELMRLGMDDPGEVSRFALGQLSRLYANRGDIGNGVLRQVVPNFTAVATRVNVDRPGDAPASADVVGAGGFRVLTDLLEGLGDAGVAVTVVAMPTQAGYVLPDGLTEVLDANGSQLLDMRFTPGLKSRMYVDPIHLGPEGAEIFTRTLAQELGDSWTGRAAVGVR
jgi:hypothetical protein